MTKIELQAAIRAAFDDVPYPGDDNIGDPHGRDDAEAVTNWLRGVNWRSLTSQPELWPLGLYYMTPQASHYYLPAYLIVGVKNLTQVTLSGVCLRLQPYDGPHPYPKQIFDEFISLLSPSQKRVIHEALSYVHSEMLEYLKQYRDQPPSTELDADGHVDTEEDIAQEFAFWEKRIEDLNQEYLPLIEYWSHA